MSGKKVEVDAEWLAGLPAEQAAKKLQDTAPPPPPPAPVPPDIDPAVLQVAFLTLIYV